MREVEPEEWYGAECGCYMIGARISVPCGNKEHIETYRKTPVKGRVGGRSTSSRRRAGNPRRK